MPLRAHQPSCNEMERGFLLVEALVALAIAALMATLVFDTVWQMGKTAIAASEKRQALLLAQSVAAAASVPGAAPPIAPHGSDGALVWTVESDAYAGEAADGLTLETVTISITDAATGHVLARLETLKARQ